MNSFNKRKDLKGNNERMESSGVKKQDWNTYGKQQINQERGSKDPFWETEQSPWSLYSRNWKGSFFSSKWEGLRVLKNRQSSLVKMTNQKDSQRLKIQGEMEVRQH